MSEMCFQRTPKERNFTVLDNTFIKDERLSWKAKGLFCYLLSLPDDWKIYYQELIKHAKDGKDSLNTAIEELINYGYFEKSDKKEKNEAGRFIGGYTYKIIECPDKTINKQSTPKAEKPITEKPITENPQLLSTKKTNKERREELTNKIKTNINKEIKDNNSTTKSSEVPRKGKGDCLNKVTKHKKLHEVIVDYTENNELRDELNKFVEHFKFSFNFKLSNASFKQKLATLLVIADNDEQRIKLVQVAIERGWKSFFPLHEDNKNTNGKSYFGESDKKSFEEYERERENLDLATDEDGNLLKY